MPQLFDPYSAGHYIVKCYLAFAVCGTGFYEIRASLVCVQSKLPTGQIFVIRCGLGYYNFSGWDEFVVKGNSACCSGRDCDILCRGDTFVDSQHITVFVSNFLDPNSTTLKTRDCYLTFAVCGMGTGNLFGAGCIAIDVELPTINILVIFRSFGDGQFTQRQLNLKIGGNRIVRCCFQRAQLLTIRF